MDMVLQVQIIKSLTESLPKNISGLHLDANLDIDAFPFPIQVQ
jgi:hypothetical protein